MTDGRILVLILAGGQSRRMGRDKAALPFGGETMLASQVHKFAGKFPVGVSVRSAGQFDTAGALEIVDQYVGQGPLAGLQAAFSQTDAEYVFLTGTDLPFLSLALAERVIDLALTEENADGWVIRRADGKQEPLCGVYSRRCVPALEEYLQAGRRSFMGMLARLQLHEIDEAALTDFDLERELDNLNTPEDYRRAVSPDEDITRK